MNSTKKSAMPHEARVADLRKAVADRADGARRLARENPGTVIVGAFAIGLALAALARHA